jgi:hypothetical protein
MPIDVSQVPWTFVALMAAFAFFAAILGSLFSFNHKIVGAVIAGVLFGLFFVGWNYYPHSLGLPVINGTKSDSAG